MTLQPAMVECTCNPSTQNAKAGGSGVQGKPGLHSLKKKKMILQSMILLHAVQFELKKIKKS
jgi:hypothetical protein